MITIHIDTNRIKFESYERPAGLEDLKEIRTAWESRLIEVIEAAGYECKLNVGVGFDPAVHVGCQIDGFWLHEDRAREAEQIADSITEACDADETCDCGYRIKDLMDALLPIIYRDWRRVADEALDAAETAALECSDELVRSSEEGDSDE
ncbi:MAG: hypothetical protein WCZ10_14540 [Desulfobulbaceae bacterium]